MKAIAERMKVVFRGKDSENWAQKLPEGADGGVLAREMRVAAVRLQTEGRTTLRLSRAKLRAIDAMNENAEAMKTANCSEALMCMVQNKPIFEACARRASAEKADDLPAADGIARIEAVAEMLFGWGELRFNRERIQLALSAFDDVQALEMAELWAVPEAIRVALSHAYLRVGKQVFEMEKERQKAEQWMQGESMELEGRSPVFFEHALCLSSEQEDSAQFTRLEKHLLKIGASVEEMIQQAHRRQALAVMRLENIAANQRWVDALNWQECFETISNVERELSYDPESVYSTMESESKAEIRTQVAVFARRCGVSEWTVARHAVIAAQDAVENSALQSQQTVCYWLYEDEGRQRLARKIGAADVRMPKMIPDPTGKRCVGGILLLIGFFYAVYLAVVRNIWLALPGLPLAWMAADAMIGEIFPYFVKPHRLLKRKIDEVPDELRTLVVMPALLSSVKRTEEICRQLETLGCLENDPNIHFLLLGDFHDSNQPSEDEDASIVETAIDCIDAMNRRIGCERFYYLHRRRSLLESDGKWMGRDRKRGALMELNRLLLGEHGSEQVFLEETQNQEALRGRYRYVLTVDADTRFLPETVHRLIGTMAHPLNTPRMENGRRRGYVVMQPQMEMANSTDENELMRLLAGKGGMDAYSASVSNFWQDLTGTGVFGGKGIYEIQAFHDALEGSLPEGKILSHDLIEGAIAGAALVDDVCFYDRYPQTLGGLLRRLHRWTRGDWQLLPILFSAKQYPPDGHKLSVADQFRMIDNLFCSLFAPALLGTLLGGLWFGNEGAVFSALIAAYWHPILRGFSADKRQWRRATAELAILPVRACYAADAILRTLWRLLISHRHFLDWVASAESEGKTGKDVLTARIAVILLLPAVLNPQWAVAVIALSVLFLTAPGWIRDMEDSRMDARDSLNEEERTALMSLARKTWHFFEANVNARTNYLPPDNVQIDPANGPAQRTSPTNIGFYLASCVAAQMLGFIEREEMLRRISDTLDVLERMSKWKGHLYNWYDTEHLQPLLPRYVSSVDSGNLAAMLLLCAARPEMEGDISKRLIDLARQMDFQAVYDSERELFFIGVDAENGKVSSSHYDLLASESRILSYTAMMLGAVPTRHWKKLSRTLVNSGSGAALASWSGTMFEYLMPELLLSPPAESLLGVSIRNAIQAQRALGMEKSRPWGVSESGYCAFDLQLNYQYRAFGLPELSIDGDTSENVVAPYASVLALPIAPKQAAENILQMQKMGWSDEFGLYEAADYMHAADDAPHLVKSHMAHHQGMILCALCNALTNHLLNQTFMQIPEARVLSLLLDEKMGTSRDTLSDRRKSVRDTAQSASIVPMGRAAKPEHRIADMHILSGAGSTVWYTSDGAVHLEKDGIDATRFGGDLLNRSDGACVHVRLERSGKTHILGGETTYYRPGSVTVRNEIDSVQMEMTVCVSPEDGTLIRKIALLNTSQSTQTLTITDCVPIALARKDDVRAHAAFQSLFVESERVEHGVLAFHRRIRQNEDPRWMLMHLIGSTGSVSYETDYEKLVGRVGSVMCADGICETLSGTTGTVLNPCSALQTQISIAPGQSAEMHFALGLVEPDEMRSWIERNAATACCDRAIQLAGMQARSMLRFLGLDGKQYVLLQRFSALLWDGRLRSGATGEMQAMECVDRRTLWSMGISGDCPILLMRVQTPNELPRVREMIRMHEFYRTLGVKIDLVILDQEEECYAQPVRDGISESVAYSHLNELRNTHGGVHLLEEKQCSPIQRAALARAAVIELHASMEIAAQIRNALNLLGMPQCDVREMQLVNRLQPLQTSNGYGTFLADGRYALDVFPERTTPAPWINMMANDRFGVQLTERGGGFLWGENSRNDRLTMFGNDTLHENWGWMFYLVDDEQRTMLRLLPGDSSSVPFRVVYGPTETIYRFETQKISGEIAMCVRTDAAELRIHTTLRSVDDGQYRLVGFVDWLMGTHAEDTRMLRTWTRDGACFASGTAHGIGYFAAANARVTPGCGRSAFLGRGTIQRPEGIFETTCSRGGWCLHVPVQMQANVPIRLDWVIGIETEIQKAYARVRSFYFQPSYENVRMRAMEEWACRQQRLRIRTPSKAVNRMANGWLLHQTLTSRIRGRTGFYQPGGAYGFRDQLQDMLAILPFEPQRVREHLLRCAAHQFEDGDVMHWWHEPQQGVRTRISDDMLFLPYVTAAYVRTTEDRAILNESIAYLKNVEIPKEREDCFAEMQTSDLEQTLHEHCMRAFHRAAHVGQHGLALMGCGDWNDGMNRVGAQGRGESVWLSMFLAACAENYAHIISIEADQIWLRELAQRMKNAVETHGWDGEWYLRAYMDDGTPLGTADAQTCRIDAISQAWAVLAHLDAERTKQAMDAAWQMLVDEQHGIVRLLTPPFVSNGIDPGYIRGYPEGIRENGGQYTHAACWLLLALIRSGDAERAHRMLQMLIPVNHADTMEKAQVYRVEPYVVAADVYDGVHVGRGGWTWYTGSASWLYLCILDLLGFQRQGNRVRMCALLGEWEEASVTIAFGKTKYTLISRRESHGISLDGKNIEGEWLEMQDDAGEHEAIFSAR